MSQPNDPEVTLDPADWQAFRRDAHQMLDAAINKMETAREGRVWTPLPDAKKDDYRAPLPAHGTGSDDIVEQLTDLLPYGVGNTHPRFFGWVHGSGTPSNILADMTAAAMNANLGGRDHGAIYVEQQVIAWAREIVGFPADCGGLLVSGTSIATIIALKAARDQACDYTSRQTGPAAGLIGYTSAQTHSCVAQAFDVLGLGRDALRQVPVNAAFEMDLDVLREMIADDRAAGLSPFVIIGTAGAVNVGAIDDLDQIADIAATEDMWFHIDGAFGAMAILSERMRPSLKGMERAHSLAFDFHKWLHVNYDAGMVLVRSEAAHRKAFSARPDYLQSAARGLAGGDFWPTDYGPELSRGFRALKVWTQIVSQGTDKLGAVITQNCAQASYLADLVDKTKDLERLAPVSMNICCFRYAPAGMTDAALDRLNDDIVVGLQEAGIAAPSTTKINGQLAIRVNITNHRTQLSDLDILVKAVGEIGAKLVP